MGNQRQRGVCSGVGNRRKDLGLWERVILRNLSLVERAQKPRESKTGPPCTGRGCGEEKENIFKSESPIIVC